MNRLLYAPADEGAGGGAAGAAGEAGAGGGAASGQGAGAADWLAGLEPEIKAAIETKGYKSPAELAKAYVHAERAIGADKLVLPGKDAKPEDWANWEGWARLGRPEKPDGYELQAPDGWKWGYDAERAKRVAERAYKVGITKAQLAALHAGELEDAQAFFAKYEQEQAAAQKAIDDEATQKWGVAKAEKIRLATAAAKHLGFSQDDFAALPFAVRDKLATLAEQLKIGEDGLIAGEGGRRGALTPDEAKAEIAKLERDDAKALFDRSHPNHAEVVRRRNELYALAYPSAPAA